MRSRPLTVRTHTTRTHANARTRARTRKRTHAHTHARSNARTHACTQGRPVYIYHFGALDWDACKKVSTGPRVLRFTIYEYERLRKVVLPVCSRLAGRNIDQTLGIVDLKGASLSKLTAEFRKVWMLSARWSQVRGPSSAVRC